MFVVCALVLILTHTVSLCSGAVVCDDTVAPTLTLGNTLNTLISGYAAPSTICLDAGVYNVTEVATLRTPNGYGVSIVGAGEGQTLITGSSARVFDIDSAVSPVTVSDLTFDGGGGTSSAVVARNSTVVVEFITFKATQYGLACVYGGVDSDVSVTSCSFIDITTTTTWDTGALAVSGYSSAHSLVVESCTFANCSGGMPVVRGGAVNCSVANSVFVDSVSLSVPEEAIEFSHESAGPTSLTNITVVGTRGVAGKLLIKSSAFGPLHVDGVYITDVAVAAFDVSEVLTFSNVTLTRSYWSDASTGPITLNAPTGETLNVDGLTISNCTLGGAHAVTLFSSTVLRGFRLVGVEMTSSSDVFDPRGDLTLTGATLRESVFRTVVETTSPVVLSDCDFVSNSASGFHWFELSGGHTFYVTGCSFVDSRGASASAILLVINGDLEVTECVFHNSTLSTGVPVSVTGHLTMTTTRLTNTAADGVVSADSAVLSDVVIAGSQVAVSGIDVDFAASMHRCVLSDNTVSGSSGMIDAGENLELHDTVIAKLHSSVASAVSSDIGINMNNCTLGRITSATFAIVSVLDVQGASADYLTVNNSLFYDSSMEEVITADIGVSLSSQSNVVNVKFDNVATTGALVKLTSPLATVMNVAAWNCSGGRLLSVSDAIPGIISNVAAELSQFSLPAILCSGSGGDITISNCNIQNNTGNAAVQTNTIGSLSVSNCDFSGCKGGFSISVVSSGADIANITANDLIGSFIDAYSVYVTLSDMPPIRNAVSATAGAFARLGGGSLTADGLVIEGAQSDYSGNFGGGAFADNGNAEFILTNLTASDCVAAFDGGGFLRSSNVATVEGAYITRSSASTVGGAFWCTGSCTLTDVTIVNSVAGTSGGGIYCTGGDCQLTRVRVLDATASGGSGGGISVDGAGSFSLTNVVVSHCSASSGGGIYLASAPIGSVSNATVSFNSAGSSGGGVYVEGVEDASLDGVLCTDNSAPLGGCLAVSNNDNTAGCSLTNSVVRRNTASTTGAALFCSASASCTVATSSLTDNDGPAVFVLFQALLTLDGVYIARNAEPISAYGAAGVTLTDVTVTQCTGTAIFCVTSPLAVNNSVIRANSGDALVLSAALDVAFESTFVSSNSGTGLSCYSPNEGYATTFTDSVVCDNGVEFDCESDCVVTGLPGVCKAGKSVDCGAFCSNEPGFCVNDDAGFAGPYDGCFACNGPCQAGNYSCPTDAVCTDTAGGGYECACPTGFLGNGSVPCVDVDECSLGTDDCAAEATCANTVGSFVCTCNAGYNGTGVVCEDIDECANGQCATGATCENSVGGYSCKCGENNYGNGYVTCTPCPGNMTSLAGSTNITDCECVPNTFNVGAPEAGCGACPRGYRTQSVAGAVVCVECPPNTFSNTFNSGNCEPCGDHSGTGGEGGAVSCDCIYPFYKDPADGICKVECGPGTYRPNGGEACPPCPLGTWSNDTNAPACTPCPLNSATPAVGATLESNCTCNVGYANLNTTTAACERVCQPGEWRPTVYGLDCEPCDVGSYSTKISEPRCQDCPDGSTTDGPRSTSVEDCTCPVNYYTPDKKVGTACLPCPEGGKCRGGIDPPIARKGFAVVEREDGEPGFVACVPAAACAGNGRCAVGYDGELCERCEANYYRLDGYCYECKNNAGLIVALCFFALFAFCAVLVWFNSQERALNKFASVVIGINAIQIAAMYGSLDLDWPPVVQNFFSILSFANFNIELVSPECAVKVTDPFVLKWLLTMFFPLMVVLMFAVIYGIGVGLMAAGCGANVPQWRVFKSFHSIDWSPRYLSHTCIRAFFQLMTIGYLPLSATVFEFFFCVKDGNGNRVLSASRQTECYTGTYWALFPLALIGVAAYPVGVPTFAWFLLNAKRKRLGFVKFNIRYGFLVGRFKPEFYFYEMAVMARKFGIAFCMSFLTDDPYIKAAGAVVVLFLCLTAQLELEPYRSGVYNAMESACLLLSAFVLLISVIFQASDNVSDARTVWLMLALLLIVVVIVIGVGLDMYDVFVADKNTETYTTEGDVNVKGVAMESMADASHILGAGFDLDASGLDSEGKAAKVLLAEDVTLQTKECGSDEWVALGGGGVAELQFCIHYSSLQYFLRAESVTGAELFEHYITVEASYHIAGLRTHEVKFANGTTVAITFTDIQAGHSFAQQMADVLPPDGGMLTGMELYELLEQGERTDGGEAGEGSEPATVGVMMSFKRSLEEAKVHMQHCVAAMSVVGIQLPSFAEHEVQFVRNIGEGGYGAVKLYTYGKADEMAVKICTHAAEVASFVEEAVQLHTLDHPNIMRLIGVCPEMLALGAEFMEGGDAFHRMTDRSRPLPYSERLHILYEAAKGLVYMHEEHDMAHRDIKPMNILLGADGVVKLGDLGLAGDSTVVKSGFTRRYAAPEQFGGSCGTKESDVFAFGVTMLEILTGLRAYDKHERFDKETRLPLPPRQLGVIDYNCENELSAELSTELASVIEKGTWAVLPADRPTMRYVSETLACALAYVDSSHAEAAAIAQQVESAGAGGERRGFGVDYGVTAAQTGRSGYAIVAVPGSSTSGSSGVRGSRAGSRFAESDATVVSRARATATGGSDDATFRGDDGSVLSANPVYDATVRESVVGGGVAESSAAAVSVHDVTMRGSVAERALYGGGNRDSIYGSEVSVEDWESGGGGGGDADATYMGGHGGGAVAARALYGDGNRDSIYGSEVSVEEWESGGGGGDADADVTYMGGHGVGRGVGGGVSGGVGGGGVDATRRGGSFVGGSGAGAGGGVDATRR